MTKKNFFKKINFNKSWDETDWEQYFQAHEAYRLSMRTQEVRKKPVQKIKFAGGDAVEAFEPVLREYGLELPPSVLHQIKMPSFVNEQDDASDIQSFYADECHAWGEGVPLHTLPVYRDCCRFAIRTSQEIDRYLKRRDPSYRRKTSAEFENLRFHANWVALSVAQGHQVGYAKERIRGNIVRCRRAVKHANQCMALINRVSRRTKSAKLRKELFSFSLQLRNVLYLWIDELRAHLQ